MSQNRAFLSHLKNYHILEDCPRVTQSVRATGWEARVPFLAGAKFSLLHSVQAGYGGFS
jgi:hypothetical protein